MIEDADDLDRRLAHWFQESGRPGDPENHPAPETLAAYQARELPIEEADALQEHLVQCGFCTDLLLELQRFLEPGKGDGSQPEVVDLGAVAGWRKLREGVSRRGVPVAEVVRLRKAVRRLQALVALLLVAGVGLGAYSWRSRQDLGMNLVPASPSNLLKKRGGPEKPDSIKVVSGDVIIFSLYDLRGTARECKVEIRGANGQLVWGHSGLQRRGDSLTFPVPSRALSSGSYRIYVTTKYGASGEYSIIIVS